MKTMRKIQRGFYARFNTSLGPALFAATPRGLCGLGWEISRTRALRLLGAEHPTIRWAEKKAPLARRARSLEKFLTGRNRKFEPSLDLHGTPFQQAVWRALRRVPVGRTATYRDLAARAGFPRAVRAAANACGQNPVAIAVPCHRIIRSDGSLGGYSSGLWRKKFLLKLEGMATKAARIGI